MHHNSSGFNNSHNVSVSIANNNNNQIQNNNVAYMQEYQENGAGSSVAGGITSGLTQATTGTNLPQASMGTNQPAAWTNMSQNSG